MEEKRSVTNSKSSLSNSQQLNDSGTSTSSNEHSKNLSTHLQEEGEIFQEEEDDEGGACVVM